MAINYHQVGKTLKKLREQQELSQDKLSDGIMNRSNYAKLEQGTQTVSKGKLSLLLNRLGCAAQQFFPYPLTEAEFKVYSLRDHFDNCMARLDINGMRSILKEMEALSDFKEGLHRQFLLKSKAALLLMKDNNTHDSQLLLDEAIKMTIPKFQAHLINTYLLGREDIEIVNMIADVNDKSGHRDTAILILTKLAANIRKRYVDPNEKARSLTLTLFNLSNFVGLDKKYNDALQLCNEGIEAGENNRVFTQLPMLKFNKAYCLFHLNQPEEVESLVFQAYYGCLSQGQASYAEMIEKHSYRFLQITIKK